MIFCNHSIFFYARKIMQLNVKRINFKRNRIDKGKVFYPYVPMRKFMCINFFMFRVKFVFCCHPSINTFVFILSIFSTIFFTRSFLAKWRLNALMWFFFLLEILPNMKKEEIIYLQKLLLQKQFKSSAKICFQLLFRMLCKNCTCLEFSTTFTVLFIHIIQIYSLIE